MLNNKTKISALFFIFFTITFFILPTKQAFGVTTKKCCCSVQTVYSKQDCEDKIMCGDVKDSAECAQYSEVWDVPPTYIETQLDSCDKLATSICETETKGVLAYTSPGCAKYGNCNICDGIKVFTNIAQMIMGVSGAVALLFFIIGGFLMILSQGKQEMVERGKKMLIGTLVGLVIILGAWQMTRIAIFLLVMKDGQNDAQVKNIWQVFVDPTKSPCEYIK